MATVQKFDHSMIESYLDKEYASLYTTEAEDGIVTFTLRVDVQEDCGCMILCLFQLIYNEVYLIRVIADKPIHKSDWGRALSACNTFMMEERVGRAVYLDVEDYDNDETGLLVTETSLDVSQGIHQQFLDTHTEIAIGVGYNCFSWMHQEQGLL